VRLANLCVEGKPGLGLVTGSGSETTIVDVAALDSRLPRSIDELLESWDAWSPLLAALPHDVADPSPIAPADAELVSPVCRPGKIVGVGLNYRDHAEETGQPVPDYPTIFAKFPTSVTGPRSDIVVPSVVERPDYEGELGVVIGRYAKDVDASVALDAVAGYTVINDVSARDIQNRTSQWTLGKSLDTFAPIGPWLVTADDVPDPQRLAIETRVNGKVVQQSNTRNMVFSVADIIALLSSVVPLVPGDVIATGTPAGVGGAQDPPRFLEDGDVVEVEIECLGQLSNRVRAPHRRRLGAV
jgi:acylpyruvate hydrolase